MKVKLGFVSNSSSSSFCIVGVEISDNDLISKIRELSAKVVLSDEEKQTQFISDRDTLIKDIKASYLDFDDKTEWIDRVKNKDLTIDQLKELMNEFYEEDDDDNDYSDDICHWADTKGLDCRSSDGTYWIGLSISDMDGDETLNQFKAKAKSLLDSLAKMMKQKLCKKLCRSIKIKEYHLTIDEYRASSKFNKNGKYIVKNWGILYWVNGKLHKENGPAVEFSNGTKYWKVNGEYHRLDGPSIESHDGYVDYFIFGELFLSKKDYETAVYLYKNNLENYI